MEKSLGVHVLHIARVRENKRQSTTARFLTVIITISKLSVRDIFVIV